MTNKEMPDEIYIVTGCKEKAGMWAISQINKEHQKIMGKHTPYIRKDTLERDYILIKREDVPEGLEDAVSNIIVDTSAFSDCKQRAKVLRETAALVADKMEEK